jgi:hypothetical protein
VGWFDDGASRRRPFFRVPVAREVDEELSLHVEMLTRQYVARGMRPTEARAAALHRFGDVEALRESCVHIGRARDRDVRRAEWWAELRQDLAYAWRQLARSRGFTAARCSPSRSGSAPPPRSSAWWTRWCSGRSPSTSRRAWCGFRSTARGATWEKGNFAVASSAAWQRGGRSWERIALVYPGDFTLAGGELPERVVGERVTSDYFAVFGVRPALGRGLRARRGPARRAEGGGAQRPALAPQLRREPRGARPHGGAQRRSGTRSWG